MLFALETSFFDVIAGLPLHPLVVHAAVVLLPLAALGLLVEAFVPALRRRYAGLTVLGLAVGVAAAFVAKESGESLARTLELPKTHAFWGGILPWVSAVLLVVAAVWYVLQRRAASAKDAAGRSLGAGIAGAVMVIAAVATLILTVVVGHSGAVAVWEDDAEPAASATASATATATPTASASAVPSSSPSAGAAASSASPAASQAASQAANALTMAVVSQHNSATSCWSVVEGNVYDLTTWIARHPGGQKRILGMCGQDATAAFRSQHSAGGRANTALTGFKKGVLAG